MEIDIYTYRLYIVKCNTTVISIKQRLNSVEYCVVLKLTSKVVKVWWLNRELKKNILFDLCKLGKFNMSKILNHFDHSDNTNTVSDFIVSYVLRGINDKNTFKLMEMLHKDYLSQ